jgi:allose kinase
MTILGMDIGGTNIRAGFVDDDFNLSDFSTTKTAGIFDDDKNAPEKLTAYIAGLIKQREPDCVSLGVPPTVSADNRTIYSTPNIKGIDNVPIAEIMESAFHKPCFVSRDVCMHLVYDIYTNKLDNTGGFVLGFYIGTGLASAIVYNGELVTGRHGVAGELGHIPVLGKKDLCGCGKRGCIELYASGKYLVELQKQHYPELTIGQLLANYDSNIKTQEFIDNIGAAIATEINILDPEKIILGGGVVFQQGFPCNALETAVRGHTRSPYPAKNLSFIYSKESQENAVIGAGIFALRKLKNDSNSK